jgi:hypothetical protein
MERVEYYETAATRNMHALPRFGNTNDFALLFGTQEQRSEYIYGLLFAGIFIYAWFIAWLIVLLVFKCLGQRRVGLLSGSPMKTVGSKRPVMIRTTFIISVIIVVVFSGLLVSQGLTQLRTGMETIYNSSVELNRILEKVNGFANALQEVGQSIQPLKENIVARLANDSFCPGINLTEATGVDFDSILNDTVTTLDSANNFTIPKENQTLEALNVAQKTTNNVENTTDNITPSDWQSLIFVVPFSIFAFLYLVGVALAWRKKNVAWYTCILSWVVLPIFVVFIVICFLCSGAIAIGASANADFCSGGTTNTPEGTITEILAMNGYSTEDLVFRITTYYIQQCAEVTSPLDYISVWEGELNEADASLRGLDAALRNVSVDTLESICGDGDFQSIEVLTEYILGILVRLVEAALGVLEVLSCETIVPLYTTTFYSGTCEYSVQGVTWTFASFLVIAVFGMIMITFRTAYLPMEEDNDAYKTADTEPAPVTFDEEIKNEPDSSQSLSGDDSSSEEEWH